MLDGRDRFEHFGRTSSSNVSGLAKPALNFCMNELVVNINFLYPSLQLAICGGNPLPSKLLQVAFLFILEDVDDQGFLLVLLYCW